MYLLKKIADRIYDRNPSLWLRLIEFFLGAAIVQFGIYLLVFPKQGESWFYLPIIVMFAALIFV